MFWIFISIACVGCLALIGLSKNPFWEWKLSTLWPIRRDEVKRIFPLLGILFLIAFNYYALKSIKDTLVITSAGATAIPFIKTWALLPATFFSSYLFALLSIRFGSRRAFLMMLSLFMSFYALFAFFLYPNRERLLFNSLADWLLPYLPEGFHAVPVLIRHWTFTLFYIVSELWSVIILNVCFWGFLNEVTAIEQAKRFYPILRTGLNMAGIISGQIGLHFAQLPYDPIFPFGETAWDQALIKTLIVVLFCGLGIFLFFCHISSQLEKEGAKEEKRSSYQHSFADEYCLLTKNRTILYLSCITCAFSFLLNTTEMLWSAQVYKLYPDPLAFSSYMHRLAIVTSLIASSSAFFLSGNLLKNLNWISTALITPSVALFTSFFFFLFFFFSEKSNGLASWIGFSNLEATVFFGAAQSCLVRSFKSSLLDINKDLALMELSKDMRVRGKAVVDGIATRSGKALASVSLTLLLGLLGSVDASAGPLSVLSCFMMGAWFSATYRLGQLRLLAKEKKISKTNTEPNN